MAKIRINNSQKLKNNCVHAICLGFIIFMSFEFQVAGLIQERACTQPSYRISSAGNREL
nr:hypothetical protein [uncultured Ilyobacter sp.]